MSLLRPKSLYLESTKQQSKICRSLSSATQQQQAENSAEIDEIIYSLVTGNTDNVPQLSSKIVRVFISSTFSDMVHERNLLMGTVYPELKNFCKTTYRMEFQMVDLRWGIREEAHDNHTIIDFCLREIENCKHVSAGPNFVVLLGQKYGFRPFPPTIEAREFENIRAELASEAERTNEHEEVSLLDEWFNRDCNSIPNEYVLQPISSLIPAIANEDDMTKQEDAQRQWNEVRLRLLGVLRKGVSLSKTNTASRDKYFVSVTEYEIERGLLNVENPHEKCLCFVRTIRNLTDHAHLPRCRPYLDIKPSSSPSSSSSSSSALQIDFEAQKLLEELQNKKILSSLNDERNYEYFDVVWEDRENRDPADQDEYLSKFGNSFRDKMQWLIGKSAQRISKINSLPKMVEIIQQLQMGRSRSESLRGREGVLKKIRLYLTSAPAAQTSPSSLLPPTSAVSNKPLVLYGEYGSGKTSVSARVAFEAKAWFQQLNDSQAIVLYRFLGTTCLSCNMRLVLSSVCWQIAIAYEQNSNQIPSDYPGLVFYFHEILKIASQDKPLVLIFDGLDQLGSSHKAHGLAWLPYELPDHVRMVVSTVPHTLSILATLHTQMADVRSSNFVEIHPLGTQVSVNLIKEWLQTCNIDLTSEQFAIVNSALQSCSLPLFTKLVFEEVRRWRSYFPTEQTTLQNTIEAIICSLFDRVEGTHGHLFVKYTLSYLTASRKGLSDVELEDILSLDDDVLNDVFQHWLPPLRRIPPLLVPRLLLELSSYIIQRESNGTMVYSWFHAQFINVARKRYLSDEKHRTYIHNVLAHYFLGTWGGGNKKPFKYSEKQIKFLNIKSPEGLEDRKVPLQPLVFGKMINEQSSEENFNLRKLSELPYHLLMSKMYVDLRQKVLFNYNWLYAKLTALSLHDALGDYSLVMQSYDNNEDISLLYNALRMSGGRINNNPRSLAFDLFGRLLNYYNDEFPGDNDKTTSALSPVQNDVKMFLQQCDQESLKHSALIPLIPCFEPPKSAALFVLEGHNQQVCDLEINDATNELISVSKDGYLAFWDLLDGERNRIIDISSLKPGRMTRLFHSIDQKHLVVDSDRNESPILIIDSKTGQCLHRFGSRKPTLRRGFIAGKLFCRQKSLVDVEKGNEIANIDDFSRSKSYVACALTHNGRFIFISESPIIKMFELGRNVLITYIEQSDSTISVLQTSSDDEFLFCGYEISCLLAVVNINLESESFGQSILQIDFYQFSTKTVPIAFQGISLLPEIFEINICHNAPDNILVNVSKNQLLNVNVKRTSHVAMKEITKYFNESFLKTLPTTINKSSFNYDGQLVLASANNYLNIWNSSDGEFIRRITIHSTVDFPYPWCVSRTRNIIATGSTIDSAVRVWDLDKKDNINIRSLKVYMNPVDCIACSPVNRLVYVKSYFALNSSSSGYKFFDRFGIDVWNVSTGSCINFIPFSKYGRLIQMKSSLDGRFLALLLNTLSQWYVTVLSVLKNEVICTAHLEADWQCRQFEFSPDWDFLASDDFCENQDKVNLWNIKKEKKIVCFQQAKSPLFTLDGQFLLYIDAGVNIIVYNLKNLAPSKRHALPSCGSLACIPIKHHSVLVTTFEKNEATVVLWDFHGPGKSKLRITGISKSGFSDISKNGMFAVDDLLQVFNLETGDLVTCFRGDVASEELTKCDFKPAVCLVRLTYDGKYCFWFDELNCLMKVGRVGRGDIVAQANVHEQLTTLETMDYGYVMFAGRKDGHVIIMKLLPPDEVTQNNYIPKSETDRRNYLLDLDPCPRCIVTQFDRMYQAPSQHLDDSEINVNSRNIILKLTKDAELPRLFTFLKTSDKRSTINSSSSSIDKNLNSNSKSPNLSKRFLDSSMSRNANSLPRKRLNSKVEIQLVNTSNASLASRSSQSSQNSLLNASNIEKSQSENHLNAINGKLSKLSLDSLISGDDGDHKKKKVKAFAGSHSMKMTLARPRTKFLSLFSHKEKSNS